MKNLITTAFLALMFFLPSMGEAQVGVINDQADYFLVQENTNFFPVKMVSYDMEFNKLGVFDITNQTRDFKATRDYVLIFKQRSDVGNSFLYTLDRNLNEIANKKFRFLEKYIATDNVILILERDKFHAPIKFVTYDKEFNKIGELERNRRVTKYTVTEKHIIIEEEKSLIQQGRIIYIFDFKFNLIGTKEVI